MSVTVTISRRASAFRTFAGVFYALFETTYPADQANPNPTDRCVAFGTLSHVMTWIFGAMASCETGFLVSPRGRIDPLDYLRFWQTALQRPDALFTQPIWIKASHRREATIPTHSPIYWNGNRLPFAAGILREHGYTEMASRVEAGETIVMDLKRDAQVLADLYGGRDGVRIEPWRIIEPHGRGEGDLSLAPLPNNSHCAVPRISIYRLDHDLHLCAMVRGFHALSGSADELMVDFIRIIAPKLEERGTGCGARAIAAFRRALSSPAQDAPDVLKVAIDKAALLSMVFYRAKFEAMAEALGTRAVAIDWGLRTTIGDLRASGQLEVLAQLPSTCVDYRFAISNSGVPVYIDEPHPTVIEPGLALAYN